ncbi:MAG: EVE domain-containing protein [Myxococcales bacterium]|nr:EVE domain-containing protein [Myxococcales bacterium]
MARRHWLVKSEPFKYAWDALVRDGRTHWDGVRNYEARNNLAAMEVGDLALYYHSNEGKEVVGVARVCRESYPDPTSDDPQWVVVDVEPLVALAKPVALAAIKKDPALAGMQLLRRSRLSVVPVEKAEFERVLALGGTRLPKTANGASRAKRGRASALGS